MPSNKNVVFDVVGTLVSYNRISQAIDTRLGPKLRGHGIQPSFLTYTWVEVAEREYTYLSVSGAYTPYAMILEKLFPRMLVMAGISDPATFSTPEDLAYIMGEYASLELRPGALECVQKLRDAGFTVWALTAGDLTRVGAYLRTAGVNMPAENLVSCDTSGIGKPDPRAYQPLLEKLVRAGGGKPWFAAAHMWDVSAAKRTGWVSFPSSCLWVTIATC